MHDVNFKLPKIDAQGFAVNETNIARFNKRVLAMAIASCMAFAPWGAEAAGLGKLTVFSGLGQPLRAELDVSANKDELLGMTVRLAQRDAFKQAGIEYSSVLNDLRFNLEKRPSGQTVVKLTSLKPLNEPFVDFLMELDWPSGRLVREYTFLLDPPDLAPQSAVRSIVDAKVVETVRGAGAMDIKATAPERPTSRKPTVSESPAEVKKPSSEMAGTRVVHHGDTLQRIAGEMRVPGVSLEQMLIGLFRNNPDAFVGKSIHRLKEGAILAIPQKDELESIPPAEARRTYLAQAQDWHGYRQKLAAATANAPAKNEAASAQSSSGKISAKLEDKTPPAEKAKDQVKVARTDAPAKGPDALKSAGVEEDRIARDKAYKEAQERLATLEKNVADLQKLLEMKNQKLAELQQAAVPKKEEVRPPVTAVAPAPVAPRPVAEAAKPVEPAVKPQEVVRAAEVPPLKPSDPPKPAEPAKPAEVKPAEVKPAEPATQEVKPPAPKPKRVVVPPPPPPPEPDLIDSLLADPVMLFGGVGGLLALLGLGGFAMYRRRGIKDSPPLASTAPVPSSLGPNSVFRMTGGQSVDTANIPLQTADFSQTGAAMIDTDEVDPVAEADVYIAYGRDTQAEEILLDALNKDPQRTAIHAKLLEIYASRGSLKQFETLASELYAQTDGQGPDWAKVAALGVKLDPNNPLYFGAAGDSPFARSEAPQTSLSESSDFFSKSSPEPEPFFTPAAAPVAPPVEAPVFAAKPDDDFSKSTLILPSAGEPVAPAPEPVAAAEMMTLDFDLGVPEPAPVLAAKSDSKPAAPVSDAHDVITLDFDLGSNSGILSVEEPSALDFDLNVGASAALSGNSVPETNFSAEGTMIMPDPMNVMDTSFDLGALEMPQTAAAKPVVGEAPKKSSEMSLDFDFDMPPPVAPAKPAIDPAATVIAGAGLMAEDADSGSLDFDVDLGASMFMTQVMEQPKFDITTIDLDLAPPKSAGGVVEAAVASIFAPAPAAEHGQDWEEANTKLDLAKAYEEMGDADGASELLREVIAGAPPDLVEQAKAMLGRLGV